MPDALNRKVERALWLSAALIVALSYYAITTTYERKLIALQQASQEDYAGMLQNRQLAANAGKARSLVAELQRSLAIVTRNASASTVTAAFVGDLDGVAKTNRCRLLSVVPALAEGARPASNVPVSYHPPSHAPYAPLADVEFVVRGDYRGVLHFLAAISRAHALVDVQSVSLSVVPDAQPRGPSRLLDAKIRAILFRFEKGRSELAS